MIVTRFRHPAGEFVEWAVELDEHPINRMLEDDEPTARRLLAFWQDRFPGARIVSRTVTIGAWEEQP